MVLQNTRVIHGLGLLITLERLLEVSSLELMGTDLKRHLRLGEELRVLLREVGQILSSPEHIEILLTLSNSLA